MAVSTGYFGYQRQGMNIFEGSTFNTQLDGIPFFNGVYWGDPTLNDTPATYAQFYSFVQTLHGPFFVFPESTALYAMTGTVDPIRLVWLHRGLTFPDTYDPTLDQSMVSELKQSNVQYVILETNGFIYGDNRAYFVLVDGYIQQNFHLAKTFGGFQVYARNSP